MRNPFVEFRNPMRLLSLTDFGGFVLRFQRHCLTFPKLRAPLEKLYMRYIYWTQYHRFNSSKDLFKWINIEPISACNGTCWFCPSQTLKRPVVKMSRQLFTKIIDELASLNYSGVINLHFRCDPIIHKDFPFFVSYVSKSCPKASIFFSTNGIALTEDLYHEFMKNPNVGIVVNDYSCGGYELKRMKHWKLAESERKRTRFNHKIEPSSIYNSCGFLETKFVLPLKQFCMLPFQVLPIGADGKGILCCNDWHDTSDIGNVKTDTLREIWQSKVMETQRDLLRKGVREEICSKCDHLGFLFKMRKIG